MVLVFGWSEDDVSVCKSGECYKHKKITNEGREGGIEQLLHKGFREKKLRRKDIREYISMKIRAEM